MNRVDESWAAWIEAERIVQVAFARVCGDRLTELWREADRRAQVASFEWVKALKAGEKAR